MEYVQMAHQFMADHWLGVCYVGIAAITALNKPGEKDGGFYGWFYRFAVGLLPIAQNKIKQLEKEE